MQVKINSPSVPAVITLVLLAAVFGAEAADSDLSTSVTGPQGVAPGDVAEITVGYHNAGPNRALNAFVNAYIPSGVPGPINEITQAQFDALQASVIPDSLGNSAFLFFDEAYCEHLLFQVQQDDGDPGTATPMIYFDIGVSDAVSFELQIPIEPTLVGGLIIDEPPALAHKFKAAVGDQWLNASDWSRYSRGSCDPAPDACADLSTCFGSRLSVTDPIAADFELVDDGSADPTFACEPLIGFTPGNIALIERGACEFGTKGVNAQDAGAVAVILVNDGLCGDFPGSPKCSLNFGAGALGSQVTIPIVMLSVDDGEPVVTALTAATPVRGRLGAVSYSLAVDAYAFMPDVGDVDPDPSNDISSMEMDLSGIFLDAFESGDLSKWN